MSKLVTAGYFAELTGFKIIPAKQILRAKGSRTSVRYEGEPTYRKAEIDALAATYIAGMKPISAHEITREEIVKKYCLKASDFAKLAKLDGFPKPSRRFMDVTSNKGMQRRLWDRKAVSKVDIDALLNKKRLRARGRNVDRSQQGFSWQLLSADIIIFCSGRYMLDNNKIPGAN